METIVGIDLGTTNSVVSIVENGRPRVIAELGDPILPSVVGVDDQGGLIVGRPACNQLVLAPERTVKSIKRQMGEDTQVTLGTQWFTPQEVSAVILRKLKQRAEADLNRPVKKAVITVPAFFSEVQREATRSAGEMAGLEVVRIINEPTAASLAYVAQPDTAETLLVYDLGGGTFDVSVVQIESGVVEVRASHGDTHLGGDDFDQLLLDHVCEAFLKQHSIDLRTSLVTRARMIRTVEEAKKQLSFEPIVQVEEEFIAERDGLPLHLSIEVHRHEYESLILSLVEKTLKCVDQSLNDAGLTTADIDRVVLVGGSTRTPLVQRLLDMRLGLPLHTDVDPDLCVAMGAAVQGALIAGQNVDAVLVDITPHSLGIRCCGHDEGLRSNHRFARLVRRNSPLPASGSEIFMTMVDGQKVAEIEVYQGEQDDIRGNEKVGSFLLSDLASVEAGNEILVRFALDLDGILKVTATERKTGNEKRLTVDNAMERFRQQGGSAAQSRLAAAFEASDELRAQASHSGEADSNLETQDSMPQEFTTANDVANGQAPELQELLGRAREALRLSAPLMRHATAEDAEELKELLARMETAVKHQSSAELTEVLAELEDLVFYLQDA